MPTYQVTLEGGGHHRVEADAVRVEHGALLFTSRGAFILAFASGAWTTCYVQNESNQ